MRSVFPCPAVEHERVDPLLLFDEVRIPGEISGTSFPSHPYRDFEIITYIVAGAMGHVVDDEKSSQIKSGGILRITVGCGIWHGEAPGEAGREPMHGLQLWINVPRAEKQLDPSYQITRSGDVPVQ